MVNQMDRRMIVRFDLRLVHQYKLVFDQYIFGSYYHKFVHLGINISLLMDLLFDQLGKEFLHKFYYLHHMWNLLDNRNKFMLHYSNMN